MKLERGFPRSHLCRHFKGSGTKNELDRALKHFNIHGRRIVASLRVPIAHHFYSLLKKAPFLSLSLPDPHREKLSGPKDPWDF